ncbi:MAG: GEVED domain-containing protein [Bacteroidota bacterium]
MKKNHLLINPVVALLCLLTQLNAQTYCIPAVSSAAMDDEIAYVMFATMSNVSTCSQLGSGPGSVAGAYANYTGSSGIPNLAGSVTVPTVTAGNSYPLAVGLTMCNFVTYSGIFGVFIDYNQNGSFSDAGENIWNSVFGPGAVAPAYTTFSASAITIPCTALPGLTRLRVWQSETSLMGGPCGSITWGEVEDYAINIVTPASNLTVTPSTASVCPGNSVVFTATGGGPYTWSGGISNGVPFIPTASGVYTVSSGTGSCAATKTAMVVYNPPLTILNPPSNICANASATLTSGGGITYTWSTGATGASIVVTPSVNTTYTVYGTSNAGCNTQGVLTVSVVPTVPSLTITSSNGTPGTCTNTPLSLTASGAVTYTWTGGISNGVAFTPTIAGSYTVTGSNACGSSTAAATVSIHPIPLVTASVNNPTICSGNSVILNGGGALTYTWTPSAPNNSAFSPNATATYTVKGTSALGCTASAVQGVTVLNTPSTPPVVTPTAICFGGVATLSAGGATGFTWTPGNNQNASSFTVSPPISTTYTLYRTNGPCASTATVNLVVNPLPLVNATASSTHACAGSGVNIVITGPITNTTFPPGFTASNFTVYPNTSVTYTVVGSNGSCTASATVPVAVYPSPVFSINSSTTTICEGQSVTLTASGTGALTYTWQPLNSNNLSVNTSPPTTTIITLSATNSFSCTTSQSQLVVVNPVPNMSLTTSSPFICAGGAAVLSIANPSANITYSWSTGAQGMSIQVSPQVTTSYFATGINTLTGCQNTNVMNLAVFISTFSIQSPTALCNGSSATLTALGQAANYLWNANGGIISPTVAVSPVVNTVYFVTGTTGSCSTTQSVSIIVNPLPNVTASVAKKTICKFEIANITGNGALTYNWNTGATTQVLTFTLGVTTTYTLTGTDLNGCSKTVTVTQFVATCIGVEDLKDETAGILIYPNPGDGNFTISAGQSLQLRLVDVLGRQIATFEVEAGHKKELTVNGLPAGVYFITGESAHGKVNQKIIIEK